MPGRPVALEDLYRIQLAGDTQISPDGSRVAFTVKRIDKDKNKYFTRLWMADESEVQPFTADGHSDNCPRWSPDGSQIAFASDRDDPKTQLYLISPDGGEARKLTDLEEGAIDSIAWSRDGRQIAFRFRLTPPDYRKDSKKEREEKGLSSPVRVHSRLFYRLDGFGYFDDSYWQLWVADAQTGKVTQLTSDTCNVESISWAPDGKSIAFTANRDPDGDLVEYDRHIYIVPSAGGEVREVQTAPGPKAYVAWSPDGQWLAYLGHTDIDDRWSVRNERVMVLPASGGDPRDLTGHTDKTAGYLTLGDCHEAGGGVHLQWSADSKTLYFPVSERGDCKLYRVNLDGSGLQTLTPAKLEMGAFSLSADSSKAGILLGSATEVSDAYSLNLTDAAAPRRLSNVNQELLAEVNVQIPEELEIPTGEGGKIHSWILRPPDFDSSKRYPCIIYVHGGPAMQYGGNSVPLHEHQWLAANGYVVLFSNPRGSKGYGEDHTGAIKGDWGNKDWIDVQAVADYGAGLPYVDSSRMAIMGGSYGGYMTAWAVGHTDRFRCAITDRLVGNLHSMSGTSDFPWEHGKFYKGNAWDDPSDLWRVSPLHFAGKITTPLMIVHSDMDLRCPIGQAEELFAALRLQKKEVEFIQFPGESSHGLSRNGPPDLQIQRLKHNLRWLDKYLKG